MPEDNRFDREGCFLVCIYMQSECHGLTEIYVYHTFYTHFHVTFNLSETVKRPGRAVPIGKLHFHPACEIADNFSNNISSVVKLPVAVCSHWFPVVHIKQNITIKNRYIYQKVKKIFLAFFDGQSTP
jgi:hypothetical protein